jgi:imidazolonepropionase-like amidohydrolase
MKRPTSLRVVLLAVLIATGCSNPEEWVAFKNINLVPMTGEKTVANQTVLVKGDRIHRIGKSDEIKIPAKAAVVEGNGAYLMPGLADMHVHLTGEWPLPQLDLYLANGVTTVRDLDGRDFMLQWQNEIRAGKRSGPTIYASGPIIRGYEENAFELVSKQKSGYDCVKLYSYFTKKDFRQALKLAKAQKLYTIGHIPFAAGLDEAIAGGMDEIAHIEEVAWELVDIDRQKTLQGEAWFPYLKRVFNQHYRPFIDLGFQEFQNQHFDRIAQTVQKLVGTSIRVNTTLYLDEVIVQKLSEPEKFLKRPTNAYLPQKYINSFLQGKEKHQLQFKGGEDLAPLKYALDKSLLIQLHKAGIPLTLGTDAGTGAMGIVPGFSVHEELRVLTENGFSPYEAIRTATFNASGAAAAMTGKDDFGTIEMGKRADFILLENNPLDDIANLKNRLGVMAAGRWYGKNEIQNMIDPALLPTIPLIAGVVNVRTAENEFTTIFDILIGKSFRGRLPDDIDAITVRGPQGAYSIGKDDFSFWPVANDFWIQIPGSPKKGTYKFTVTSGNRQSTATDTLSIIRPIPVPDIRSLRPADGETIALKTPTFSWGSVYYFDAPIYYLFQIYNSAGEEIFRKGRTQNMTSHTVPAGILKPGETYRWRVRISDSGNWLEEQNRSHTKKLFFRTAETLN